MKLEGEGGGEDKEEEAEEVEAHGKEGDTTEGFKVGIGERQLGKEEGRHDVWCP